MIESVGGRVALADSEPRTRPDRVSDALEGNGPHLAYANRFKQGAVMAMRMVLLGGAPGVGKTTVARELLRVAAGGDVLLQWIDVDALWAHQPWRVDEVTINLLHSNLRALLANAAAAGFQLVVITWVYQDSSMLDLLERLAPPGTAICKVQLRVSESTWRQRFAADTTRPAIDDFFRDRYQQAQATEVDYVIETDDLDPGAVAAAVASAIGLSSVTRFA